MPDNGTFGVFSSILILVLTEISLGVAYKFQTSVIGNDRDSYYASVITISAIGLLIVALRPKLMVLSDWRLRPRDIVLAAIAPILIQSLLMLFDGNPSTTFVDPTPKRIFFIALLGPAAEEILCRAIVLRSLVERTSRILAVLIASGIISTMHESIPRAFVQQTCICIVYIATDYSIFASILFHVLLNSFVFFPLIATFQKWHIYTLWNR